MKKTLLFSAALLFITTFSSCKKCYTCSNVCYDCHAGTGVICSTDAASWEQFNYTIATINSTTTNKCTLISPTQTKSFCEKTSTANDLKSSYEALRYECKDK